MQKVQFFMGSPEEISVQLEKWQYEYEVKINQISHAIATFVAPMPAVRFPSLVGDMQAAQLTTILSVMVVYEEKTKDRTYNPPQPLSH